MPFVLSLAASLLGWGRAAFAWLAKLPWYVLALAACVGVILWQHGAETRKDARIAYLSATLDQVKVAQAQAQVAAQVAHDAQETAYRAKAQTGQQDHDQKLAAAQSAVDDLRDRLRAQTIASRALAASPGAQGGNPDIPATVPTDSQLSLSEADVRACASATAYAVGAHDWALGLNQSSSNP